MKKVLGIFWSLAWAGLLIATPGFGYAGSSRPAEAAVDQEESLQQTVACQQEKNAAACTRMGLRLVYGAKDFGGQALALDAFRQACTLGDGDGCRNLGLMYERGIGVPGLDADPRGAADAYRRACDLGHALGCRSLGTLHLKGSGVPVDHQAAATLFEKACTDGKEAGACTNLGALFALGLGFGKDPALAVELYRTACGRGEQTACANLGWCHEAGEGVTVDRGRAAELYRTSCASGNQRGCRALKRLNAGGTEPSADESDIIIEEPSGPIATPVPSGSATLSEPPRPEPAGSPQPPPAVAKPIPELAVCDCDGSLACARAGFRLLKAEPSDPSGAAVCFAQSCILGEGIACTAVGLLRAEGRLKPPDTGLMCGSFAEACAKGHQQGCEEWNKRCRQPE